ncbi:MAG TPA: hypothetical protein DEP84_23995 [Chloroflexi bacterium]|nr:hypothetical protein [Chloroflexota bacterium]
MATVVSDAGRRGQAFLDRQLSLPASWCEDERCRTRPKVPAAVGFETRS